MSLNEKEINSTPTSNEVDLSFGFHSGTIKKVPQIRAVVKEPGKSPEIMIIENTLRALQGLVRGYIEVVDLEHGVCLICNDEGKYIGLIPNFRLPWKDTIMGTAVFASYDEEGNFTSLSDEQIDYVLKFMKGE